MKLVKTASGKKTIKISKSEWQSIGNKAGWMKTASIDYPATIFYPIQFNGETIDLVVNIRITNIKNDGIGRYEFWGAKEFDAGHDSIGDYQIDSVESDEPSVVLSSGDEMKIKEMLGQSQKFKEEIQSEIGVDQIKEYYQKER